MDLNEKNMSIATRRKMGRIAKRTAKKRQLKKKLLAKRLKTPAKIKMASQKAAKNVLVKKLTGGKSYSDLSITQKQSIDRKLKPSIIAKVARRLLPKVRAKEKERVKRARQNVVQEINELGDGQRFQRESIEPKHGVLTLNVDGSQPEVSARFVNGKLKPYVFKTRKEAQTHTDNVGGKSYESAETGKFYVEFTKLDGPVNEDTEYKTANEIKKHWKKEYPNDKFTFKKVRAKGNEWLLVLSPKGIELERYQHVPKTGWIEMNENKDNEEDLKSLKSMLDIAQLLSSKSPYFKGRGSKKEYIKMLLHKIKKLSENHEQFLEIIKVPISIGDTVLGGKFKNKKIVVKNISKNEKGDLTLNGKPLMKVRLATQKGQMFKEASKEKKNQSISRQDAYKQVRKSTMPKSRPMKSKKVYDRKDYKKDIRD